MITYLSAFQGRHRCWLNRSDSSITFKCSVYFTSTTEGTFTNKMTKMLSMCGMSNKKNR